MPRSGPRVAAVWTLAALAGLGALVGVGRVATAPRLPAPAEVLPAAMRLPAAPADDRAALPPGVLDRVAEALTDRPGPARGSVADAVLGTGLAALVLAAGTRGGVRAAPTGPRRRSGRPQSPRAPPVAA